MFEGSIFLYGEDGAQTPLPVRVMRTGNMFERMRGLLGREPLQAREAMLIDRCASIHTCGMRYSLDLVFMDRSGKIRKLVHNLKPWRFAACYAACMTLEMPAGAIDLLNLKTGMRLLWQKS